MNEWQEEQIEAWHKANAALLWAAADDARYRAAFDEHRKCDPLSRCTPLTHIDAAYVRAQEKERS